MITSTTTAERRPARAAGFTLVEIMIGATLGAFVLAGILSTFLMLSRSGARLSNYNAMSIECRRALEEFGQDVRMASNVTWNSASSVTLTVPDNYTASSNRVTYAYDSATTGITSKCLYRVAGSGSATTGRSILVRNVTSCVFNRYDRISDPTSADSSTKRVEMTLKTSMNSATAASATETAISATFVLRNKPAS